MKALETIVATAVIVFALTTVAVAGVQRLGGGDQAAGAPASATATTAQQSGSVTLTAQQFAALLHAVGGSAAQGSSTDSGKVRDRARERMHDHAQDRSANHAAGDSGDGQQAHMQAQTQTSQASGGGGVHHPDTPHDGAGMHDGGTHNAGANDGGGHDGGTHHGGGNDGGCD